MALKSNFNEGQSMKDVERQAESIYQKILSAMIYAAETFIVNAREQGQDHAMGQYQDDTTNLRNSIQYLIFHNGELVKESESAFSSQNRAKVGGFVKPTGFQLILIAGMDYASFVESKGYNVISYQADVCFVELAGYLENLELVEKGTAARMEETFVP